MRTLLLSTMLAAAATACTPYSPDLGAAPFLCGPPDQNPRCPSGYTCMTTGGGSGSGSNTTTTEYCLSMSGELPIDGGNGRCADDHALEPNETKDTAWITPVDMPMKSFPLASLAICPAGDKDTYSVQITTNLENLEMIIEYEAGGADLQGAIQNAGGIAIANASMTTANTRRAYAANLNTGIYYVQVTGPSSGSITTNNYKLTLNVTGP